MGGNEEEISIRIRSERSASWLVLGLVVTAFAAATFGAAPSGAIFTTTATGTTVNGNIYDSKDDVYLNGGPQIRTRTACRRQLLFSGHRSQRSRPALDGQHHVPRGEVAGGRYRRCVRCWPASIRTARLIPRTDRPRQADPYWIRPTMAASTRWLTPVANYSPNPATPQCSSISNLTFGFCNADSKTDNFKVRGQRGFRDHLQVQRHRCDDVGLPTSR